MSIISSSSLFHFYDEAKYLLTALDGGFIPRLSLEEQLYFDDSNLKFAFPMVCFCDIPLSLIGEHIKFYGEYGIGMKRSWAKKNRIIPIHYQNTNFKLNDMAGHFHTASELANLKKTDYNSARQYVNKLYHSLFLKPYDGYAQTIKQRGTNKKTRKVFYDEREWRYTISQFDIVNNHLMDNSDNIPPLFISEEDYNDKEYRESLNSFYFQNLSLRLRFSMDDISIIIVPNENIKYSIINEMQLTNTFKNADKKHVVGKLFSLKRTLKDF